LTGSRDRAAEPLKMQMQTPAKAFRGRVGFLVRALLAELSSMRNWLRPFERPGPSRDENWSAKFWRKQSGKVR
jgi:hypothetical protein